MVPDCNGGTGQTLANQPINTSSVLVQQINACTWTASPILDSTGSFYRVGVAETIALRFGILRDGPQHGSQLAYKQRQQIRVHPRDSNASWMSARFS
jgi:hypothetical protein